MKIAIYCDGICLHSFHLPMIEISAYVDLVRKHGFEDDDGNSCVYSYVVLSKDGIVIYVDNAESE